MPQRKSRSKAFNPATESSDNVVTKQLEERLSDPPKLFLLPDSAISNGSRFVSLADPATGCLNKYIYCPSAGFFELTRVSPPPSTPSSCLVVAGIEDSQDVVYSKPGYLTEEAAVYVVTPLDPVFFVTQLLMPGMDTRDRPRRPQMRDAVLEDLGATSKHMRDILRQPKAQSLLLDRLEDISDVEDFLDQTTYLPDASALLQILLEKAELMTRPGAWPASLEHHVKRQLEVPVMPSATESQLQQQAATDPQKSHLDNITAQLRLRIAIQFIMAMYIRSELGEYLQSILDSNLVVDHSDLDKHLQHVQTKKSEVQALRSLSDNISRKRSDLDDDEAIEAREAKRRKKEDDEKKRKAESRATKELRKADTSGMKKLSSFFTKK